MAMTMKSDTSRDRIMNYRGFVSQSWGYPLGARYKSKIRIEQFMVYIRATLFCEATNSAFTLRYQSLNPKS